MISQDLKDWTAISDQVHFPEGTNHWTGFKVEESILKQLLLLE